MIETRWFEMPEGIRVAARVAGSQGAPVIFVHGVGSTAAIWDYQLRAFENEHRMAAIELRGNGAGAGVAPELITREGFARDVLAVAGGLGFERFHFVGCSLGGVVAFELLKTAPQRLRSVVFVGSFAAYPNAEAYAHGVVEAVHRAGDMKRFSLERSAKLGLPPQRFEETVQQMGSKSVPSYIASTWATWTGDYRAMLAGIEVPSLVIHGERDTIAPRELSEEIASGIPGARLKSVADAGHVTNADAPEAFNELLRDFWSGVS